MVEKPAAGERIGVPCPALPGSLPRDYVLSPVGPAFNCQLKHCLVRMHTSCHQSSCLIGLFRLRQSVLSASLTLAWPGQLELSPGPKPPPSLQHTIPSHSTPRKKVSRYLPHTTPPHESRICQSIERHHARQRTTSKSSSIHPPAWSFGGIHKQTKRTPFNSDRASNIPTTKNAEEGHVIQLSLN